MSAQSPQTELLVGLKEILNTEGARPGISVYDLEDGYEVLEGRAGVRPLPSSSPS